MTPGTLAWIAGATAVAFGGAGLLVPEIFAAAFGIQLDGTGAALSRLACASYIGFGALNLMARHLEDAAAWRAISAGNAVGWAVSAGVVMHALAIGLGQVSALLLVVLQIGYAVAWAATYVRVSSLRGLEADGNLSAPRP